MSCVSLPPSPPITLPLRLEDLSKCVSLVNLSLRACFRVTDDGLMHVVRLASAQSQRAEAPAEIKRPYTDPNHRNNAPNLGLSAADVYQAGFLKGVQAHMPTHADKST